MLPQHLIAEFWDAVRAALRSRFRFSEHEAASAVVGFRDELDRQHIGDLIYHREPEVVAETVVGWKYRVSGSAAGVPA